jgi:hypothetical protein
MSHCNKPASHDPILLSPTSTMDPYEDPIKTAKLSTVWNKLIESSSDQLMVMLKTIVRMQMDDGCPCADGCQAVFTVSRSRRGSDSTHRLSFQECTRWFDDSSTLVSIRQVLQTVRDIVRGGRVTKITICPACLVPIPRSELISQSSDIYGHGLKPNPPCDVNAVNIFGPGVHLLEDPIVRRVVSFIKEDSPSYGTETANFLISIDSDRLPNIYMLFLLEFFVQPSVSFTPAPSQALMAAASSPNSHPRPEIGISRKENLEFIKRVSTAYQTAVAIAVQETNETLAIEGECKTSECYIDGSKIDVVTKYIRKE